MRVTSADTARRVAIFIEKGIENSLFIKAFSGIFYQIFPIPGVSLLL
jgi:hypothetical protein